MIPPSNCESAPGARPAGSADAQDAARNIQRMFDTIAPTYDRANHILSAGIDRSWWNRTARALQPVLTRPGAVVLDLCCGTGDMTLALERYRPKADHPAHIAVAVLASESSPGVPAGSNPAPILALDFSHAMLALGAKKFEGRNIVPIEGDALHLPLADASVDLVTSAFGFRNLASYTGGLAELSRVLRPGGEIAILECNQPSGLIGALYSAYFHRLLPTLGGLISGAHRAYAYLPDSVERFPRPPQMKQLILDAGFIDATWTSYTFGTTGLYRARKP